MTTYSNLIYQLRDSLDKSDAAPYVFRQTLEKSGSSITGQSAFLMVVVRISPLDLILLKRLPLA